MERASRVFGSLKFPRDTISAEELTCAAWPVAVGKKIGAHTHAAKMVRSTLIVEVEDAVWQRQLFGLRSHILAKLEESIGRGIVEEIEFRVVPLRRGPHRAECSGPKQAEDEASAISDPVLRSIYKAARRRALA